MVDVAGIDRNDLLKALWDNAKPASFFIMNGLPTLPFDMKSAIHEIHDSGYVDYFCGRCIKAYLFSQSDKIDPSSYDKEYGPGAFQNVVNGLKISRH